MKTVKSSFKVSGAGLMFAAPVELTIKPSEIEGIRFHIGDGVVEADVNNVVLFRGFFLLRGTAGQYGQQGCNARYRTNERVTS